MPVPVPVGRECAENALVEALVDHETAPVPVPRAELDEVPLL